LDRYSASHGLNPFNEVTKIFLIIHDGSKTNWEKKERLENIQGRIFDIGPTLLGLCNLDIPEHYQGVDLINSHQELPEFAFTKGNFSISVRNQHYKLVHLKFPEKMAKPKAINGNGFMLFDISNAANELVDIKKNKPETLKRLKAEFTAYNDDLKKEFVLGTTKALRDETIEQLKSLGYIQ